jgi:uncharacterized protein YeaO (DUF488 family)
VNHLPEQMSSFKNAYNAELCNRKTQKIRRIVDVATTNKCQFETRSIAKSV